MNHRSTELHHGDGMSLMPESLLRRLGAQELRRRLVHFTPGLMAFALTPVPHRDPIRFWPMLAVIAIGILLPAYTAVRIHSVYLRHPEEDRFSSMLGYAIPLALLALLFRGHVEIPLAVAAIMAFGDGCATFAGLYFRGARIPWNRRKTWIGLFSFVVFGTVGGTAVYWLEATPHVPLASVFLCVAPVVVACALIESLPLKVNDNISVGVSASVLMILMQSLVVGWL